MAKNILVVDDDGIVTKSLCSLLSNAGYSADASENGFDAIEKIKDTHIDLIIVDIRMPQIDGVQTVKKIKELLKSKHKPDIPVVFITGYAKEDIYQRALGLNAAGYIEKPFDVKTLLQSVKISIEGPLNFN